MPFRLSCPKVAFLYTNVKEHNVSCSVLANPSVSAADVTLHLRGHNAVVSPLKLTRVRKVNAGAGIKLTYLVDR